MTHSHNLLKTKTPVQNHKTLWKQQQNQVIYTKASKYIITLKQTRLSLKNLFSTKKITTGQNRHKKQTFS